MDSEYPNAFPSINQPKLELLTAQLHKSTSTEYISKLSDVSKPTSDVPSMKRTSSVSNSIGTGLKNSSNPRKLSQTFKSSSSPNVIADHKRTFGNAELIKEVLPKDEKKRNRISKALERFLIYRPTPDADIVKKAMRPADGTIPLDVVKVKLLVDFLIQRGLHLEGIFRVSASIAEQKVFWEEFTKGA